MGLFDSLFGSSGEGGKNAGNIFENTGVARTGVGQLASRFGAGINNDYANQDYTKQVQDNPLTSGMFGQGGTLDRTVGQEKDLSSRGFSLQPEDYEAYGQASGDISRMFGQNEQSLSQALSDRGLSSSGVANSAFAGSLGNKNEQLSQIQMQIAQQRMQMNQDRLNSTRNFLTQMGGQAQGAMQNQFSRNLAQSNDAMTQGNGALDYMKAIQGQKNENLAQYQQTNHSTGLGQLGDSLLQGGMAAGGAYLGGLGMGTGLGGAMKGMSGGGGTVSAMSGALGGGKPIDFNGPNPYSSKPG